MLDGFVLGGKTLEGKTLEEQIFSMIWVGFALLLAETEI